MCRKNVEEVEPVEVGVNWLWVGNGWGKLQRLGGRAWARERSCHTRSCPAPAHAFL